MNENFYSDKLPLLLEAIDWFVASLSRERAVAAPDPIEFVRQRVKSEASAREKLRRHGFEDTPENALTKIYDAAGVRIVCPFFADVYRAAEMVKRLPGARVIQEKDYIVRPKPNGYRSYHIILLAPNGVYIEAQVRSMAMDCWASVEHNIKYKRDIPSEALMVSELKRCADAIASTDLDLQTIRDMLDDMEGIK